MTSYEANPALKDFFKVLSLSLDRNGLPYISTMEARKVGAVLGGVEWSGVDGGGGVEGHAVVWWS
jgi:hypothetical protein